MTGQGPGDKTESAGSPAPDGRAGADGRMVSLLERMKRGDRVAAAEFIADNASRIRRRFRGKLGPDVRRLFDSQDLVSTVSRRLDTIIMRHSLAAGAAGGVRGASGGRG